ncbi:MAG TPA: DNA polymerase III subunit delta [Actinomycetota bacterium]|nr:DNA polymerase III subunit delta [Actinomycetota bacterium]
MSEGVQPAYLITGEEFLVAEALEKVRADTGSDPLSELSFEARTPGHELITALSTPSLLGGLRVVIVNDAQDMLKEQVEALNTYLDSPSPNSVLVLVATGRTKLDAKVKKVGSVVAVDAPKGRRLVSWVRQRARAHSLKFDERAAWALIDSVGSELRELDGALRQLATGIGENKAATAADIKKAFPRAADQRLYTFTDAVGDRRLPLAMTNLRRLLDQGEEPLVIVGSLAAQLRRMLRARPHADRGSRAVEEALGVPRWRAERIGKQARTYKERELIDAMSTLAATDLEIKGGDLSPAAALERAVVHIVAGRPLA